MPTKDSRIDTYIAKSAPFAQPILRHLRRIVHAGCREVEETIKWGMPFFMHRGMLCFMAAFKEHCAFGFPKRKLVPGAAKRSGKDKDAMGQFGRITSVADLPDEKTLTRLVRTAAQLSAAGSEKPARTRTKERKEVVVPADLRAALKTKPKAQATFENFSYSHRKEYVEWITGAKREETRAKRLETALAWLSQGKSRNWKYEGC